MQPFKYQDHVQPEWVDYNGHMNDAEYARMFSHAVDVFMDHVGLNREVIEQEAYTMFTLETHLCYLKEAHETEPLTVQVQLMDYDAKRLHVLFSMTNERNELISTSEQMLMGIDQTTGKPAPFIEPIQANIQSIWREHEHLDKPKQAGRTIGIKRQ